MGKYDEYVISGPRPWHPAGTGPQVAWWNSKNNGGLYTGSHQYHVHWVGKAPENMPLAKKWGDTGHGPHTHKYTEVVMHLGTDPDNPMDLGAEVEFFRGRRWRATSSPPPTPSTCRPGSSTGRGSSAA